MPNVRSLLDEHEVRVIERIAALRAELLPLEKELLEVRLAKAALNRGTSSPEQRHLLLFSPDDIRSASSHVDTWRAKIVAAAHETPRSPYARLTIKELVKKALAEHFPAGATATQLLELFANAWGRVDIERTSLSPQLSRLRQENILFREGHVWRLTAASGLLPDQTKTAADQ